MMQIKAKDIKRAERYYSGNMEVAEYILVETTRGNFIVSPAEYEQIPNRPKAHLVEVAA